MIVHLVALNVQNWLGLALLYHYLSMGIPPKMVTVQKLVLHFVDILSLAQKIESRFMARWSRFVGGQSRFVAEWSRFVARRS